MSQSVSTHSNSRRRAASAELNAEIKKAFEVVTESLKQAKSIEGVNQRYSRFHKAIIGAWLWERRQRLLGKA